MRSVVVLLVAAFPVASTLVVSCGGSTTDLGPSSADGSTSDGGGRSDASTDAASFGDAKKSDDAALSAECPSSVPTTGDSCTVDGLECEYGTSDLLFCNTLARCTGGSFNVTGPEEACANELDAGGTCPTSRDQIEAGSSCPTFSQVCEYAEGSCGCGFVGHVSDQWVCDTPAGSGCPAPRPKLGSVCSSNGLACNYGSCTILGNPSMICDGGIWFQANVACPP